MLWLVILAFALSSSIDNLGVGISYGIRRIRIGIAANLIMAVICFIFSECGILFGKWLSGAIPGIFPVLAGAFLLIIIGIRIILLAAPRKAQTDTDSEASASAPVPDQASNQVSVQDTPGKRNGLKRIWQNPEHADMDGSGEIGLGEACVLGMALSANAVTNGLGAGLLGLSPLAISISAAAGSFLTVWIGVSVGHRAAHVRIGRYTLGQFGTIISGIILMIIACESILFR